MSYKQVLSSSACIVAIALGLGLPAFAQDEVSTPKFEIGLGYSGIHATSSVNNSSRTGNGGFGTFEYNVTRNWGLVADFDGYANTNKGDRLFTYMFGPRYNWRHSRLTPYAHALFGGAHLWNDPNYQTTKDGFAMAFGGGLDVRVTDHVAIKPVQVEYVYTRLNSNNGFGNYQNDIRYSAGLVFRLGSK